MLKKLRQNRHTFLSRDRYGIYLLLLLVFVLSGQAAAAGVATSDSTALGSEQTPYQLKWEDLLPEGFSAAKLLEKYADELEKLDELPEDSEEGLEIIEKIQAELDQVPSNPKWDGKWVELPGFLAPLEQTQEMITRFLLVPYFGACIHMPPPPINQTVLVDMEKGDGILLHEVSIYPFKIKGRLTIDRTNTDIGNAGYHISQATAVVHKSAAWMD